MRTQSNVGARCPYPREGNGFADPMKIQILSLTPRFSEVPPAKPQRFQPFAHLPQSPFQKHPFSKHFKGFQRKKFREAIWLSKPS
jgi:hypothetical protein